MERAVRLSPSSIAILYCLVASISVGLASYFEGTLIDDVKLIINEKEVIQYAYAKNHSTIINFLLLNPLAIYFLLKSQSGYAQSYRYFKHKWELPYYHSIGMVVISAIVGTGLMHFYYKGFIGGVFFTAAFEPNSQGKAEVSVTGALIFLWTSLYMSFLCFSSIIYGRYILFIRDRKVAEFGISLTKTVHRSISVAIAPCVYIMYALTTLFVVLCIFILRDYVQFNIDESRRIWLLAPYLLMGLCSALPFFHLHNVMTFQKTAILNKSTSEAEKRFLDGAISPNWSSLDLDRVVSVAELIEKSTKFCDNLRVWPVHFQTLTIPNISFAISLLTLSYKIVSHFFVTQTV
ncbi:hypothetical protein [Alteromonas sp. a30]|uniref:hypothetical protein n=1 Tax=Alteromonas sp. a30 TaxID=2730917 RepID=UPI00227E5582|nr:hypothetical protein [Alteromonas sp. a30]MCY7296267.1 hypothetical protein [Alteromonas sp. a30]